MQTATNKVIGPYFALASIYSEQDNQAKTVNSEERFWSVSFDSENINFRSPVSTSTYRSGELFSSELLKNNNKGESSSFWGTFSFNNAQVNDEVEARTLEVEKAEQWASLPFGGFFAAYQNIKY